MGSNGKPKIQTNKTLKRPTNIKAEVWNKLRRSGSVKRQSSSTNINDENKKAATSGADLQSNVKLKLKFFNYILLFLFFLEYLLLLL